MLATLFSCDKPQKQMLKKKKVKLETNVLTPELLWSFGRVGEKALSPDESKLLYTVTHYDKKKNSSKKDLIELDLKTLEQSRFKISSKKPRNIQWILGGKKIAFLAKNKKTTQIWTMNPDGSDAKPISNFKESISEFKFSPDGKNVAYTQNIKKKAVKDLHADLDKANARVIDDLMYRHWDHWVDEYSHIFVSELKSGNISDGKDILEGEKWAAPTAPFDGIEQVEWHPNSKSLVYSSKKLEGMAYATSTNSDLYWYDLTSGKTKNLTSFNKGYDKSPRFSPDGTKLAWESMERDGYEADKNRLFVLDLKSNKRAYLTEKMDQNVHAITWGKDNKTMYFISDWHATDEIYKINTETSEIKKITEGIHNYKSVMVANNKLIASRVSMSKPAEIYLVDKNSGKDQEVSFANEHILSQLKMGKIEKRWVKTTDNKDMLTWVIYPPNFDKNKKYPALLYCQGGPQGTVSQFWSYRWNFQLMAANEYIIVAPNRRGLPGFGQEWNEQISGDYGGQNMKDYMSAINTLKKESFIDENRLGAIGASYGGFSVYWLAGHHKKTFSAFVAHAGMFNLEAMYLSTEEMFFVNWDLGGNFWDTKNKIAQRTYANSPHKFVDKWDTPILVIHGAKDFRIPDTQGMQAFNAAKMRNIPAKFLHYPEENHWILGVQNGILWHRTFFDWLDKYLKK
jgi:dipeptidyl aminopeptidase/acylaminoacyl peptidase